eukprot:m.889599 g.889599  ORF g.889599 m.889599 type:complete len:1676 (+) comp23645_c0_seq10:289-5316(+)
MRMFLSQIPCALQIWTAALLLPSIMHVVKGSVAVIPSSVQTNEYQQVVLMAGLPSDAGAHSYTYQWTHDGVDISGNPSASTRTLVISFVTAADAGSYYCRLSRGDGLVSSSQTATIEVFFAPVIETQPQAFQELLPGALFEATVTVSSNPSPNFTWYKGGVVYTTTPAATTSTLTVTNISTADSGTYSVVATNTLGSVTSSNAVLRVTEQTTIDSQPENVTINSGESISLTAVLGGNSFPALQWYKNGVLLPGEVHLSLTIHDADLSDEGWYTLSVISAFGTFTSSPAFVYVNRAPLIVSQPAEITYVLDGLDTVLSLMVTSDVLPVNFTWFFNGVELTDSAAVSSTTTASNLTIADVNATDIGNYTTVAVSAAGTTTSNVLAVAYGVVPVVTVPDGGNFRSTAYVGDTIVLELTVASALPEPTFQWVRNGVSISGATAQTLSLVVTADMLGSAEFTVWVVNDVATTYVTVATVQIIELPSNALSIHAGFATKNAYCTALSDSCDDCIGSDAGGVGAAAAYDCAYCEGGTINGCMVGPRHLTTSQAECESSGGTWHGTPDGTACPAPANNNTEQAQGAASDNSKSSSTGIIIGILACVVVAGMVVALYVVKVRRESETQRAKTAGLQKQLHEATVAGMSKTQFREYADQIQNRLQKFFSERQTDGGGLHDVYSLASMVKAVPRQIDPSTITLLETLGRGQFGEVYSGTIEDTTAESGDEHATPVALKVLGKEDPTETETRSFLEEAALMAQFDHPNIIRLVGVVTDAQPIMIVVELAEGGSLFEYLRKHSVSNATRFGMAIDVADGMQYLENCGFIHRDLATRNVLLTKPNLTCKIGDFGLSRTCGVDEDKLWGENGLVAIRWTAPEVMREHKFTRKTDVWSYGVLLYELWTKAALPYGSKWNNNRVMREVESGYRLPRVDNCPRHVYVLMMSCWHPVPSLRPAFSRVKSRLQAMQGPGTRNAHAAELSRLGNMYDLGTSPSKSSSSTIEAYEMETWSPNKSLRDAKTRLAKMESGITSTTMRGTSGRSGAAGDGRSRRSRRGADKSARSARHVAMTTGAFGLDDPNAGTAYDDYLGSLMVEEPEEVWGDLDDKTKTAGFLKRFSKRISRNIRDSWASATGNARSGNSTLSRGSDTTDDTTTTSQQEPRYLLPTHIDERFDPLPHPVVKSTAANDQASTSPLDDEGAMYTPSPSESPVAQGPLTRTTNEQWAMGDGTGSFGLSRYESVSMPAMDEGGNADGENAVQLRSDATVQHKSSNHDKRNSKEVISRQFKATAQRVAEKRQSAYSLDDALQCNDGDADPTSASLPRVSVSDLPPVMTKLPNTNMRLSRGFHSGMAGTRTRSEDEVDEEWASVLSEIASSMDVVEGHARDSCEAYARVTTINRADIGSAAPASAERRFTPPMVFGAPADVMPTVVEISDMVHPGSEDATAHVARPVPAVGEHGVVVQPQGSTIRVSPAGGRDEDPTGVHTEASEDALNVTLRVDPAAATASVDTTTPAQRADSGAVELYIENNSDIVQQHQATADCDISNDMYISAESAHTALHSGLPPDYVELADVGAAAQRKLLAPPAEPARVMRKPSEESSKLCFPFPSSESTSDHDSLSGVTEKLPVLRPVNARMHKHEQSRDPKVVPADKSRTQRKPSAQHASPSAHLSNARFNPSSMSPTSPTNFR